MGTTPNRGYPYPDLSSPTTVAADLEALARAYDSDLRAVQDGIGQRPLFRVVGGGTRQEYGSDSIMRLRFDVVEENRGNILVGVDTELPRTRFVPNLPGIYLITATVAYSRWVAPQSIEWVKLSLVSNTEIAAASAQVMPDTRDGSRTLSVTSLYEFSGTGVGNPLEVWFDATTVPTRPQYAITSRSLTATLVSRT